MDCTNAASRTALLAARFTSEGPMDETEKTLGEMLVDMVGLVAARKADLRIEQHGPVFSACLTWLDACYGDTPEEAVAKLYASLRKSKTIG